MCVGGLNNHRWRLDVGGRRYVVRLSGDGDESLGVDRGSEAALLAAAGAAGLAPTLVACDLENRLLITHYVDGEVWTLADACHPHNIARLAQALTSLHGLEVPAGVRGASEPTHDWRCGQGRCSRGWTRPRRAGRSVTTICTTSMSSTTVAG